MIDFSKAPMPVRHLGRDWQAHFEFGHWWARDDQDMDTGPYSTREEAIEWIKTIRM